MEILQLDINVVMPYEKNAKKHPQEQVLKIANSITEFGFNQPIVCDTKNVIIVGHGRLEAAKKLGLKTVPVTYANITEDQAKAYRLADNKLNESPWDMQLVIAELQEISLPMVQLTGFSSELVDLGLDMDGFALPTDGDGTEQMTFTLTNLQAKALKDALANVKTLPEFAAIVETDQNTNSNGNALYALVTLWEQKT